MSDTFICNGTQKSLCNVYGSNGSKQSEAPSESALSRAVVCANRLNQQTIQDRTCPWGCGRAVLCGGTKREERGENEGGTRVGRRRGRGHPQPHGADTAGAEDQ